MKPTSFNVKTALLATLIISGTSYAQSLPDEINHPSYLKMYESAAQALSARTAEYEQLAAKKAELEKTIAQMERDQGDLPAQNAELQRLIDMKRQELSRVASEMQGLESILSQIINDLRRIDNVIAQLQRDINEESVRAQNIQARRAQVAQDVNRIDARLRKELAEEQQSINLLNNLNRDLDRDIKKRNEEVNERQDLARDVERFKRELPQLKTKLANNSTQVTNKKATLAESQAKLPALKAELAKAQSDLAQADAEIAPKKARLAELEAELGRQMPEVAKLQKENQDLNAKIASNTAKINASGIEALKTKRDNLESQMASTNAQIAALSKQIVDAKEALKPDLAEQQDVKQKIRELERSGANPTELARLKQQEQAIAARIAPKRQAIQRLEKDYEALVVANAPRNNELTALKDQIARVEAQNASLLAENDAAKDKIAANQKIIDERMAANSGLMKEINDLKAAIKLLDESRTKIAQEVQKLKTQETALTAKITELTRDIAALESESAQIAKNITDMEKAIAEFPTNMRRLELHIQKLEEQIQSGRLQISREEKLLARIQQDRIVIERDLNAAQNELGRVNADLQQSNQLIGALQNKLQKEAADRDALTRYNQDSIRKYDNLKAQKAAAEKTIADAQQEITINDQDLGTISTELPRQRSELAAVTPKVASAEAAKLAAEKKAEDSNVAYQNRLSLYNRYLSDAGALGSERANIGTADGSKTGAAEARVKAIKIASENAAAEAKWVAMRRGYIRGEIAGYDIGFDAGLASTSDAQQGDIDGKTAGAKRAKDHANMVLKPEFYLEELARRLQEDEVSNKRQLALKPLMDVISTKASAMQIRSDIPELTAAEIDASKRILSSLDALIEQALVESNAVAALRPRLADARGVYTAPGAGENANNANCSGVYKNVKEFIDACKASYGARYQGLYNVAHLDSFVKEYGKAFADQIANTFNAELNRLYPGFLKEASAVGKDVGVAAGKKEIYQQTFSRSEKAAYAATLPAEQNRVEDEAVALVDEHLKSNAALTVKSDAKLKSDSIYGIAPGVEADLRLTVKNVGSKASAGNSLVKLKDLNGNLVFPARDAAIASIAPKSQSEVSVIKLKVNDAAVPGQKVVLTGEIVHPGNHYRSSRTETIRVEAVLGVNPSVESATDFDVSPKVSALFGAKKHDIDVTITQKFEGVKEGYELSIQEVNSNYVRFSNTSAKTERLNRNGSRKSTFEYKLDKSAKGKTINLKVSIKNGGSEVKSLDLQIKPE